MHGVLCSDHGRRAIYFGRDSESHVERFPPTPEIQQKGLNASDEGICLRCDGDSWMFDIR